MDLTTVAVVVLVVGFIGFIIYRLRATKKPGVPGTGTGTGTGTGGSGRPPVGSTMEK